MRIILAQIYLFIKSTNLIFLAFSILWTAMLIFINYNFQLQSNWVFETNNINMFYRQWLVFLLSYGLPLFLGLFFSKKYNTFLKPSFWLIFLLSTAVFAFTSTYHLIDFTDFSSSNSNLLNYYHKLSFWLSQTVVVIVFTWIIWIIKDRKNMMFYGFGNATLTTKKEEKGLKPYFLMLLIMVIPIFIAAQTSGFQNMYPRLDSIQKENYAALNFIQYLFFELGYGLNFVGIELFFRGFLISAFGFYIGKEAILPMAIFYVTIHFGKPMGECISSFFGGALLGIVSFHTKSIKGGLLVHLGIAWMMEIAGWTAKFF